MESTHHRAPEASSAPLFPEHDRKVAAIADRMAALARSGAPAHIDKGGVHHVVPLPGDKRFVGRPVDISSLDAVLAIDVARRRCIAEPGVSFREVVEATLKHGLLPKVVPELEGITLGGAVAGCSIESMSYQVGGFHDTCLEYEVVTGSGEVLTCSRDRDPLVFEMLHGSYGTLGVLTKLTFELIEVAPYVHLEYVTLPNAQAFYDEMLSRCGAGGIDFIDGIVHSPTEHVLCLGRFVDQVPYTSSYRLLDIFYKSTRTRAEDYLTTPDYCFRYDTECHWLTKTLPPLEWKPVRAVIGKMVLGSTNLIRWSGRLERVLKLKRRPDVVVDVFIPSRRYLEFYEWYEREIDFFPLWIVPYRIPRPYPWISEAHNERMADDVFIDCAVYGKRNNHPEIDYSRLLEDKTFELGGIKTLISRNHYTPERFWQIYHRDNYTQVKERLDPHGVFPGLFEKLHRVE